MSFLEIVCPRCTSHRVEPADAMHYRCLHCQAMFMREGAAPPMPMPPPPAPMPVTSFTGGPPVPVYRTATPSSSSKNLWIVLGVLGGGGFLFFLLVALGTASRRRAPPPAPTIAVGPVATVGDPVSAPVVTPQVAGPTPTARIKTAKKGVTINGDPFWILLYENTGESAIGNASAHVSLFDGSGRRLDEATGYAVDKNLLPKKTTPLLVLGKKVAAAKESVEPQTPEAPSSYDASQVDMIVTDFTARKDNTLTDIVGSVKNGNTQPVKFIHVVAAGLDANGDTVSYSDTFATAKELAPGASSGFKITAGTFEVTPPVRYRLFSVAMPAR